MSTFLIILLICLLFSSFCVSTINNTFRRFRRHGSRKEILHITKHFFYSSIQRYLFPNRNDFEVLFFSTVIVKNILRFFLVVTAIIFLLDAGILVDAKHAEFTEFIVQTNWWECFFFLLFFLFLTLFIGDYLPRLAANRIPRKTINGLSFIVSILLTLCLPISYIFLKIYPALFKNMKPVNMPNQSLHLKEKILEMIEETGFSSNLDAEEQKLIESVVTFNDRIVREIMIPRIKVFALPISTPLREASQLMADKGFSRAPVYQESVDDIIGVLMIKDILNVYIKSASTNDPELLNQKISEFVKPVLYTPETKKVSQLLQEFRKRQMHLAIVVDEYGGTEGICTIEDILEEIVGEIADEYDADKEVVYKESGSGWIVDAQMSIHEVEDKLGLKIPQEGDYDTVGGYIFHRAGEIPSQGLVIHHDDFELEILSSDNRRIDKVRIFPHKG